MQIKSLTLSRFYPASYGGIERHIELLLDGLAPSIQADCIVVNNYFKTATLQLPNRTIYQVPSLGTVASTPICPTLPFLAKKLHRTNHYNILHLHFPNPMAHLAAYFLPKDIKLVITWHSDIIKQKNLLKLYQPFLQHILKRADAVIAGTPKNFTSFEQLKSWGNPDKFYAVPFAIDTKPFTASEQLNMAANKIRSQYNDKAIIFAIGRHVYYKGFEFLIRAMAQIENAVLLLGGSGPLTKELQEVAAALQLNHKVKFLGRVSDEDLPAYYHACDVFCMPSVEPSEAFGLVQLEAMACKKPIVCCELNNGVTYVNQHGVTGLVVPPRDPTALASAINQLLNNEEQRKQMGEAGYQRLNAEFSLEKMWSKTLEVYERVLKT